MAAASAGAIIPLASWLVRCSREVFWTAHHHHLNKITRVCKSHLPERNSGSVEPQPVELGWLLGNAGYLHIINWGCVTWPRTIPGKSGERSKAYPHPLPGSNVTLIPTRAPTPQINTPSSARTCAADTSLVVKIAVNQVVITSGRHVATLTKIHQKLL